MIPLDTPHASRALNLMNTMTRPYILVGLPRRNIKLLSKDTVIKLIKLNLTMDLYDKNVNKSILHSENLHYTVTIDWFSAFHQIWLSNLKNK